MQTILDIWKWVPVSKVFYEGSITFTSKPEKRNTWKEDSTLNLPTIGTKILLLNIATY